MLEPLLGRDKPGAATLLGILDRVPSEVFPQANFEYCSTASQLGGIRSPVREVRCPCVQKCSLIPGTAFALFFSVPLRCLLLLQIASVCRKTSASAAEAGRRGR